MFGCYVAKRYGIQVINHLKQIFQSWDKPEMHGPLAQPVCGIYDTVFSSCLLYHSTQKHSKSDVSL